MVIKYDFPKEFRSYVQSKGRARSKPSKYIMLYSDEKEFDAYTKYQEVPKCCFTKQVSKGEKVVATL